MIDFNLVIKTENLLIRPSLKSDAEEMFGLTNVPEMWTYFTSDLSKKEELNKWLEIGIKDESRLALTVIKTKNNKIIGSTSIGNLSKRDRRAEIGWTWLGKNYQGKGYNALVKLQLLQYLFEECGCQRVELKTDVLNMPARNAVKKIGFVQEGILRSHTQMIHSRRRDTIFYSVLKNEWSVIKSKKS